MPVVSTMDETGSKCIVWMEYSSHLPHYSKTQKRCFICYNPP